MSGHRLRSQPSSTSIMARDRSYSSGLAMTSGNRRASAASQDRRVSAGTTSGPALAAVSPGPGRSGPEPVTDTSPPRPAIAPSHGRVYYSERYITYTTRSRRIRHSPGSHDQDSGGRPRRQRPHSAGPGGDG